jgi:hypothetical protein
LLGYSLLFGVGCREGGGQRSRAAASAIAWRVQRRRRDVRPRARCQHAAAAPKRAKLCL